MCVSSVPDKSPERFFFFFPFNFLECPPIESSNPSFLQKAVKQRATFYLSIFWTVNFPMQLHWRLARQHFPLKLLRLWSSDSKTVKSNTRKHLLVEFIAVHFFISCIFDRRRSAACAIWSRGRSPVVFNPIMKTTSCALFMWLRFPATLPGTYSQRHLSQSQPVINMCVWATRWKLIPWSRCHLIIFDHPQPRQQPEGKRLRVSADSLSQILTSFQVND